MNLALVIPPGEEARRSMQELVVRSRRRAELVEITPQVREALAASGVESGVLHLFVPHTTAGLTLNENMDPNVVRDMLADLERLMPSEQPYYRHGERNSAAHLKASLMGASISVPFEGARLALGPWQGIYLCEFDGPRSRSVHLRLVEGG